MEVIKDVKYILFACICGYLLEAYAIPYFFEEVAEVVVKKEVVIDKPVIEFKDLYKDVVQNMKSVALSEEELDDKKNSFVMENTPMGFVIMTWAQENKRFHYYADRKDLPYRFLDTVSRKFVKSFDCKCVYVDIETELETCKSNADTVKKKLAEKIVEKKMDDVFATLKRYNEKVEVNNKDDELLIKDKINMYRYCGAIRDFQFIKTPDKDVKKLSYSDFINQ